MLFRSQHPNGAGSTSAFHGAFNQDGAFLVLEKKGNIRAQAWVWKSGTTLVLDNVEALGHLKAELQGLFKEAAEAWLAQGISEVRIGAGMSDLDLTGLEWVSSVAAPEGCYSDAKSQVLLAMKGVK